MRDVLLCPTISARKTQYAANRISNTAEERNIQSTQTNSSFVNETERLVSGIQSGRNKEREIVFSERSHGKTRNVQYRSEEAIIILQTHNHSADNVCLYACTCNGELNAMLC